MCRTLRALGRQAYGLPQAHGRLQVRGLLRARGSAWWVHELQAHRLLRQAGLLRQASC